MRPVIALAAVLLFAAPSGAQILNDNTSAFQFSTVTEIGFVKALSNRIQFGLDGTQFNYVSEGGEDILFPFMRLTAEARIRRHEVIFLIQPLDVRTQVLLRHDLKVNGVNFPEGTPMDLRYGFDFYRASYLYNLARDPAAELAVGGSIQLRNASIDFASQDGRLFENSQDLGIVPAVKLRGRLPLGARSWLGAEIDGVYVSGRWISGKKYDFTGALLDASARYGRHLTGWLDGFVNLRYLGGGARGSQQTSANDYTDNWLHTASLTLGFEMR